MSVSEYFSVKIAADSPPGSANEYPPARLRSSTDADEKQTRPAICFFFSDTSTWLKCKCRAIIWGSHRRSFHDETQPCRPRASQRLIVPRCCLRAVSLLYINPAADDSSDCNTSTNTETTHIHTDLKIYLHARTFAPICYEIYRQQSNKSPV